MYPNPVPNKTFSLQFDKVPAGKYNLVLTDASGRNVVSKALTIAFRGQVEKIALPRTSGGGMYLVKVTGGDAKEVYNDKLVVQ
jgi:Secretion system C-terminal sorting domain